jgi:hypothetical protein
MIKARHSSELTSRRRSTALSSLRGTREGQPAGKEALAGLLDFLASSSGSLTPTTVAEPQPTAELKALPAVHNTAPLLGSAPKSAEPKKEKKKKKKEKKAKANESEGTPKKEKGSPGSAAKKRSSKSPSEAERRLPDRLAMAALLEKEKLEWEKELRTPTGPHKASTGPADMATVRIQKKERRLSFTLRRRSSANLSALVEQAGTAF